VMRHRLQVAAAVTHIPIHRHHQQETIHHLHRRQQVAIRHRPEIVSPATPIPIHRHHQQGAIRPLHHRHPEERIGHHLARINKEMIRHTNLIHSICQDNLKMTIFAVQDTEHTNQAGHPHPIGRAHKHAVTIHTHLVAVPLVVISIVGQTINFHGLVATYTKRGKKRYVIDNNKCLLDRLQQNPAKRIIHGYADTFRAHQIPVIILGTQVHGSITVTVDKGRANEPRIQNLQQAATCEHTCATHTQGEMRIHQLVYTVDRLRTHTNGHPLHADRHAPCPCQKNAILLPWEEEIA